MYKGAKFGKIDDNMYKGDKFGKIDKLLNLQKIFDNSS